MIGKCTKTENIGNGLVGIVIDKCRAWDRWNIVTVGDVDI